MNIFFVDESPEYAARMLANAHVRSQLTESYKMLSAIHHDCDSVISGMAPLSHLYHPATRWVGLSRHNYNWLFRHARELCKEYHLRWGVPHWNQPDIEALEKLPPGLAISSMTVPPAIVSRDLKPEGDPDYPIEWKDIVTAYRAYYNRDKRHLHYWMGGRTAPQWITAIPPKPPQGTADGTI